MWNCDSFIFFPCRSNVIYIACCLRYLSNLPCGRFRFRSWYLASFSIFFSLSTDQLKPDLDLTFLTEMELLFLFSWDESPFTSIFFLLLFLFPWLGIFIRKLTIFQFNSSVLTISSSKFAMLDFALQKKPLE